MVLWGHSSVELGNGLLAIKSPSLCGSALVSTYNWDVGRAQMWYLQRTLLEGATKCCTLQGY